MFVYQRRGGGGESDSPLSPNKTCFDASTAAASRLSLALFFTRTVCARFVFVYVCACVHLSGAPRRPGVEAGHKKELHKKIREDST